MRKALVLGLLLALPLATAARAQDRLQACDSEATAKKLSAAARGLFMSECLDRKPAPATGAGEASAPRPQAAQASRRQDDASNLERKKLDDARQERWNKAAERAVRSICAGCSGTAAPPRRSRAASRLPADDDALVFAEDIEPETPVGSGPPAFGPPDPAR